VSSTGTPRRFGGLGGVGPAKAGHYGGYENGGEQGRKNRRGFDHEAYPPNSALILIQPAPDT